ncbi:NADH-dependent flavin oxidoreductase-like protein [Zalerion maritima]|uniref:NADH-dependent flavin oxidoreductase-like protein n=1 Tax=Zalerion maritima TaxID=339359 RepID=A0AAD5RNJ8_9PEZI|nr:NADH-dependent flavin oxidoreductase-like protein [Zalerion maritima]
MAPTVEAPFPANPRAPYSPYYTPVQKPAPGTPLAPSKNTPTLFTPLKLRSMTMNHRIAVSPMCQYSSPDGHLTDYHLAHHGSFALHGAGLSIIEATAVQPNGRITPQDSGLWKDSQMGPIKRIADLFHSQGQLVGIQLAHAGRKASTVTPWAVMPQLPGSWDNSNPTILRGSAVAPKEDDGWPDNVVAPSRLTWGPGFVEPRELSVDEINQVVEDFASAAKRAVTVGVDTIEIHGAHGYLLTEFLSPLTNKRTDDYGGSYENRTRLTKEVITSVRAAIPETMPLWLRVSSTEWAEGGWDVPDTIKLAKEVAALGVDVLDVSSGGNVRQQDIPNTDREFQTRIAGQVRKAVREAGINLKIAAVGLISSAEAAMGLVEADETGEATADIVLAARQFLREPEWVLRVAHQLGVEVKWINQYHRAVWTKQKEIQ